MANKHTILLLLLLLLFATVWAQQPRRFSVVGFTQDQFDTSAKEPPYRDVDSNGDEFAIVKVKAAWSDDNLQAYRFNFGKMFHRVVSGRDGSDGQLWLYVQRGARQVTISREGFATISKYDLGGSLQAGATYIMELSANAIAPTKRILQFKVQPKGVEAVVKVKREGDGGDYEWWGPVDANGSIDRRIEAGTWLYEVSASRYATKEGRVVLDGTPGAKVEEVTLVPTFGYIRVDGAGSIAGADIFIDDRRFGSVPYQGNDPIDRGNHRIVVSKSLYKPWASTFTIEPGQTTRLVPQFEADFAEVTLTVNADADIVVDGETKGKRQWSGPLPAGTYNVECRQASHKPSVRQLTVVSGRSERITLDPPTPITGTLYISSTPSGAKVTIDGKEVGATPCEIATLIGSHEVRLSLNGHIDEKRTVSVSEGGDEELRVEMKKGTNAFAQTDDTRTFTITANGITVKFNMKLVKAGKFKMGSNGYSDEKPIHEVTLTKDYYIGETEVTQALWQAVMGSNPSFFLGDKLPVENVSWNDCQTFISRLNAREEIRQAGVTFRLPTEAEWEFAARGGTKSRDCKWAGTNKENALGNYAWYGGNSSSGTHEVATKQANELGLYDMSGNVLEWCSDWHGSYGSAAVTNPQGASAGSNRVARGGCWLSYATNCCVANRINGSPAYTSHYLGLRLASQ